MKKSDDRDPKQLTTSFYCQSDSDVSDHEAVTDSEEESQGEPLSRKFLRKWLKTFSWLQYNSERDVVTYTVYMKASKGNKYVTFQISSTQGLEKGVPDQSQDSFLQLVVQIVSEDFQLKIT